MTASSSSRRTWRFAHVLMTLAFGAAVGGCFNPPAAAVLFACDAKTAPACPDGYTCAEDDCCHRDGSDIDAELGSCRIGGGMNATDSGATDTSATDTSATDSTATDTSATGAVDTGSSDAGATT